MEWIHATEIVGHDRWHHWALQAQINCNSWWLFLLQDPQGNVGPAPDQIHYPGISWGETSKAWLPPKQDNPGSVDPQQSPHQLQLSCQQLWSEIRYQGWCTTSVIHGATARHPTNAQTWDRNSHIEAILSILVLCAFWHIFTRVTLDANLLPLVISALHTHYIPKGHWSIRLSLFSVPTWQ